VNATLDITTCKVAPFAGHGAWVTVAAARVESMPPVHS
jgi:hypothetical protein